MWKRAVVVLALVNVTAARSCVALSPLVSTKWCNDNCNSIPSFCPPEYCGCDGQSAPSPVTLNCIGFSPATSDWCNQVCSAPVPFCPRGFCDCSASAPGAGTSTSSRVQCVSVRIPATDVWCTDNCNAGFCPGEFCRCNGTIGNSGGSGSTLTRFVSTCITTTDAWCTATCTHNPAVCPADCCALRSRNPFRSICPTISDDFCTNSCGDTANQATCNTACCVPVVPAPQTPLAIEPNVVTDCCIDRVSFLYYISNGDVFRASITGESPARVVSPPQLCGDFLGAADIAVTNDGDLFVADNIAASLFFLSGDCTRKVQIETFHSNQRIGNPSSVTVVSGGLIVTDFATSSVWNVRLNSDLTIQSLAKIALSTNFIQDFVYEPVSNNGYFIDQGKRIVRYNFATNTLHPYLNDPRIVDIDELAVSNGCGLFFAANDNDQVWFCPSLFDGSTCRQYCCSANTNSHSCQLLQAPTGVAIDCSCNLFAVNSANGNMVYYSESSAQCAAVDLLFSGGFHMQDVEVWNPRDCSVSASPSPSPSSILQSQSPTPTPTSTPTPTASPSASPSLSASPTPTSIFTLQTIFTSGATNAGASQGNQQQSSRTFQQGHGLLVAFVLVSSTTGNFVRFVDPAELQMNVRDRLRLFASLATTVLRACPTNVPLNSVDVFLLNQLVLFLAPKNGPASLTAITTPALFLNVNDFGCLSTGPVPVGSTIYFTWALVWNPLTDSPCISDSVVGRVCLQEIPATSNVLVQFASFLSNVGAQLPAASQLQTSPSLFPGCVITTGLTNGCPTSTRLPNEVLGTAKSDNFCFPQVGNLLNNQCGSTTSTIFGCFCDRCCPFFGDCCPDVNVCFANGFPNPCANPASAGCITLCDTTQ